MEKRNFNYNPVSISKKLLSSLDKRPADILVKRFGLASFSPKTLESIGKEYGITRERVRQIEVFALNKIRQSDNFKQLGDVFGVLGSLIKERGGVVQEEDFLSSQCKQGDHKACLRFLLTASGEIEKFKEDESFHRCWAVDARIVKKVKAALSALHNEIGQERLLSKKELLGLFGEYLKKHCKEKVSEDTLPSLIKVSKQVASNAMGEWGFAASPFVNPKGMRDCGFLVMRKHGSPMHFSEVAGAIKECFERPAHVQTVHNELIKDARFVLVGRGLYALKEWGYESGIVRNVVQNILKKNGPLLKEDILKKVMKERYVKENTILVNLQNRNFFKKDEEGKYMLI